MITLTAQLETARNVNAAHSDMAGTVAELEDKLATTEEVCSDLTAQYDAANTKLAELDAHVRDLCVHSHYLLFRALTRHIGDLASLSRK